jgi:uncharacterized protein
VASHTDIFDLGRLALHSGEGRKLELNVRLPGIELAGQTYRSDELDVPVRLDVSRTTGGGYALRLRYAVRLTGPCMRCLEDAGRPFDIEAREVHQPGSDDDELTSPYLHGDELDLSGWARDSLVLDLPTQIVCREDCLGICPQCGENLNENPEHHHEPPPDPRWAKLGELRLE